jgi:methylated-DNA-protein-cysteine methyltransferase-like protein
MSSSAFTRKPARSAGEKDRGTSSYQRIYAAVRRIPRGRVATYGQIARLAGLPRQPRLVGYALHALASSTTVPWHRVVNARGMVSIRGDGTASLSQRLLLEGEGVAFDGRGRLSLDEFQWRPSSHPRAAVKRR